MSRISRRGKALLGLAALTAATFSAASPAAAKEFILTSVKPNTLVLVDPAARKVARTYKIASPGPVMGIVPSPDGKVAYVVTNHWGSLIGIDLDTGKEVFHTDFSAQPDMSAPAMRVINTFGLEISPDGKELFVMQSPVKLGKAEYQVQDTRIAVYDTRSGLAAEPVRLLPVPRRTTHLLFSEDGTKLYCLSWDLYTLDPKDGKVLQVTKLLHWDRQNYAEPDIFGVWGQYEQAHVFINPYFTTRTDLDPKDPASAKTGMLTLDLKTGAVKLADFEDTSVVIFSSVVNPVRRNESYSVYSTLTKTDLATDKLVKRVALPHTYYTVNVSGDGKEIYVGGTMNDIGIYSTDSLKRIGEVKMPGGNDQAITWVRMVHR